MQYEKNYLQKVLQAKLKLSAVFETIFANISKYVGSESIYSSSSGRHGVAVCIQYTWAGSCRTAAEAEKIKLGHRFLAATTTLLFSPPWLDNNNIAQQGSSITMYTIGSVMKKGTLMSMAIVHAMPITYLLYYKNFINFPKILEM